jgi:RHS repeat-associated protein
LQRFRYPDWQGTIRAESNPSTRAFTESLAFAPFGERYALKGAPFNVDSFTGKPDQLVPDEYDFPAREEHNGQGRWVSPDPMRGTGNKYVYADNNPLSKVDLYGLFPSNEGVDYSADDGISSDPSSEPLYQESHPPVSVQTGGQIGQDQSGRKASPCQTAFCIKVDVWEEEAKKNALAIQAQMTFFVMAGVARIRAEAARRLYENANPGIRVPFDTVRQRYYDMAHIKALADGGTNAAENLKPQEHGEHMAEHMANGDFARWASNAKAAAKAAVTEIESDARDSANQIMQDIEGAANEIVQDPGEAARDAGAAFVEAAESGEIPPP